MVEIEILSSMQEISATAWDALQHEDSPFVRHAFLASLEESKSVCTETGWQPCHLLCYESKTLLGAMPLYLKSHSYGEYIFDWAWADAARRSLIRYYPKLVSAVPFTPATGPRILLAEGAPREKVAAAMAEAMRKMADETKASSVHVLFCTKEEQRQLAGQGFFARASYQFHWENHGYRDFEDYLASFRASVRKQVRKERAQAVASGLRLVMKTGAELNAQDWEALYGFYQNTTEEKHAIAYLQKTFFLQVGQRMPENVIAALAYDGERPVAGALAFSRGKKLFGRYWGSFVNQPSLHFELCYYRMIEWAIAHGMTHVEAGAQGEHKLKRGYLPAATYSAHWIRHEGLSEAVGRYVQREAEAIAEDMKYLHGHGPFHRDS